MINKSINIALAIQLVPMCLGPAGESAECNFDNFITLLGNIINYFAIIAVPLAAAAIVYAGIILVSAGANESKRSEAKKILWTAVWGLVIVLAAWLIVKTIVDFLLRPGFPNPFS